MTGQTTHLLLFSFLLLISAACNGEASAPTEPLGPDASPAGETEVVPSTAADAVALGDDDSAAGDDDSAAGDDDSAAGDGAEAGMSTSVEEVTPMFEWDQSDEDDEDPREGPGKRVWVQVTAEFECLDGHFGSDKTGLTAAKTASLARNGISQGQLKAVIKETRRKEPQVAVEILELVVVRKAEICPGGKVPASLLP